MGVDSPTIMYVSPIAAIGAKKGPSEQWIDKSYQEIFELKASNIKKTMPPKYNSTPCGRSIPETVRNQLDDLLYASGMPSLEQEMNYYAQRYALYKKSVKGQQYLLEALALANRNLEDSKVKLEEEKINRIKEQKAIQDEILNNIDSVKKPAVNDAVKKVKSLFQVVLDDYCRNVPTVVETIWDEVRGSSNPVKLTIDRMQEHCQKNLYDANSDGVNAVLQEELTKQAIDYMNEVKKCVVCEFDKFSTETIKELEELFVEASKRPRLENAPIGVFERIEVVIWSIANAFGARVDELFINIYSSSVIKRLKGKNEGYGVFAQQCIKEPADLYSVQINSWIEKQKEKIKKTLNQDNAILSSLDNKIRLIENRISDLEIRLDNLENVQKELEGLIPKDEYDE